jgi:hypothetical protein
MQKEGHQEEGFQSFIDSLLELRRELCAAIIRAIRVSFLDTEQSESCELSRFRQRGGYALCCRVCRPEKLWMHLLYECSDIAAVYDIRLQTGCALKRC